MGHEVGEIASAVRQSLPSFAGVFVLLLMVVRRFGARGVVAGFAVAIAAAFICNSLGARPAAILTSGLATIALAFLGGAMVYDFVARTSDETTQDCEESGVYFIANAPVLTAALSATILFAAMVDGTIAGLWRQGWLQTCGEAIAMASVVDLGTAFLATNEARRIPSAMADGFGAFIAFSLASANLAETFAGLLVRTGPARSERLRSEAGERRCEHRRLAQRALDLKQAVVLGDALAAAGGAGLDLAAAHGHGEIRHEGVFGLAGTMRDDEAPARVAAKIDGLNRLGHGADLVEFDQHGVRGFFLDAARDEFVLVTKISSPTIWMRSPMRGSLSRKAGPVVLVETVLDGHDRIGVDPFRKARSSRRWIFFRRPILRDRTRRR